MWRFAKFGQETVFCGDLASLVRKHSFVEIWQVWSGNILLWRFAKFGQETFFCGDLASLVRKHSFVEICQVWPENILLWRFAKGCSGNILLWRFTKFGQARQYPVPNLQISSLKHKPQIYSYNLRFSYP